jgi:hypothetical protein
MGKQTQRRALVEGVGATTVTREESRRSRSPSYMISGNIHDKTRHLDTTTRRGQRCASESRGAVAVAVAVAVAEADEPLSIGAAMTHSRPGTSQLQPSTTKLRNRKEMNKLTHSMGVWEGCVERKRLSRPQHLRRRSARDTALQEGAPYRCLARLGRPWG